MKTLTVKELIQELNKCPQDLKVFISSNSEGIIHGIKNIDDLDEASSAYKDIDEVMENQKDLVEILVELKPLAVIKG